MALTATATLQVKMTAGRTVPRVSCLLWFVLCEQGRGFQDHLLHLYPQVHTVQQTIAAQ